MGIITSTMLINITYAVICIIIGIASMFITYKLGDKLTSYKTDDELKKGNLAVAVFNAALILGSALLCAIVTGLACN